MNREFLLKDVEAWKRLAENLQRCEQISKHDHGKDREAWTLSHAFADLEQSFRRILDDKLPTLMNPEMQCEEICNLLLDIGEEFRHILYHIHDSRFYAYLGASKGAQQSDDLEA